MTSPRIPRLPVYLFVAGLLAGCGAAEQTEATRAWIASAKREAGSRVQVAQEPEQAVASDAETVSVDGPHADPFGMAQRRNANASGREADPEHAKPIQNIEPQIRVLGTLVQEGSAYAVLQVDGRSVRVRTGDELPAKLGRVIRVDEQSVEIANGGTTRVLEIGNGDPPASASGMRPARQPKQRRLVRPGADA
ncbi:pilus assembly protein PilP [Herbaspirillum sp.]|uniref:pilus assembly protein PilP n=1 Tax=Herbaspirillum sp. TaxID=1890675 RepID=UPI0031DD1B31